VFGCRGGVQCFCFMSLCLANSNWVKPCLSALTRLVKAKYMIAVLIDSGSCKLLVQQHFFFIEAVVKKVFMWASVLFIVSCDVIERRGLRLKATQTQSSLGREGTAPSTCRRQVSSCRPSSPFSLSMGRSHAKEPTNNETLQKDVARNQRKAKANGPPKLLPIPVLTLCGGAMIKAVYTKNSKGDRDRR